MLGLRRLEGLRNIYIISVEEPEEGIWVPESAFPFSIDDVKAIIKSTNGREGWYLQQLLKLYVFRTIDCADHVLLFDSDCVICRPVTFIDDKILLDWSEEIHVPYFSHMLRVSGIEQLDKGKSGIADHMLVRRDIMEGLLSKIEGHTGKEAWRALLEEVEPAYYNYPSSGMSEYELYFNYALTYYPNEHRLRRLERVFGLSFGALKASQTSDIISFHAWAIDFNKKRIELSRTGEEEGDETRPVSQALTNPAQNQSA